MVGGDEMVSPGWHGVMHMESLSGNTFGEV